MRIGSAEMPSGNDRKNDQDGNYYAAANSNGGWVAIKILVEPMPSLASSECHAGI